jgi:hypothetical protein
MLSIDGLAMDLWIDGAERPGLFNFRYLDYQDKFKGNQILYIPPNGFAPRWYRNLAPVKIKGALCHVA